MFGRTKFGLTVLASFMADGWVDYNGLYTSISVIIFPQLPDHLGLFSLAGFSVCALFVTHQRQLINPIIIGLLPIKYDPTTQ